jgi:two-component system, NarL family, invasion response regulator UvrY
VATDVRVLTVDDQPPFRDAARRVIEATPGFESVGELASAEEAFEFLRARAVDLVFMDVRMPGMNGLEAARRLTRERPELIVVLVSGEGHDPGELSRCGARSFARKRDFGPALLRRLRATYL